MSRRTIFVWTSLLLTACNGGVAVESFPDAWAAAYCETLRSCYGRLADRARPGPSCEREAARDRRAELESVQVLIDAGRVTYDPALGADCVSAAREHGCEVLISAEPDACRTMFEGTAAEGEPCSVSMECAGDAYCASSSCPESAGTCTARAPSGQPCARDDECQSGLACEGGMCRTPASTSGGVCGDRSGRDCPLDEVCVRESLEMPGTCKPFATVFHHALGEPCDIEALDLCTTDLACAITGASGTTQVAACVAPAASGGSCNAAVPSMCPAGEYCTAVPSVGRFEGTCEALPSPGQACAPTLIVSPATAQNTRLLILMECAAGAHCDRNTGTCRAWGLAGESCTANEDCYSYACDGGDCAAPPLCI